MKNQTQAENRNNKNPVFFSVNIFIFKHHVFFSQRARLYKLKEMNEFIITYNII